MTTLDRLVEYVRTHRWGMVNDLLFALVWVGLISVVFTLVDGPQWAYYLLMLTGIPAYFGFLYSWKLAVHNHRH